MITFLPDKCYDMSSKILDRKRLGKQRVEALMILRAICGVPGYNKYINHPAVKMWQGHGTSLYYYLTAMCNTWKSYGYEDNCLAEADTLVSFMPSYFKKDQARPFWRDDEKLYSSHRSNLLRKKPEFYGKYEWCDIPTAPYYWPTKKSSVMSWSLAAPVFLSSNVTVTNTVVNWNAATSWYIDYK